MAEQSFPFENIDTTEDQFSQWASNFQDTGVQGSPTGTELKITAEGSTLTVDVALGQAFIRGHYYINTESIALPIASAGLDTRIDYVVIELDPDANTIVAKIVQGTAVSSDPVAPTLTQTATGVYQLPIAKITIPNSTLAITNGMIADVRTFMSNRIGIWTTDTRPANPIENQTIGYNTTTGAHEVWNGTIWATFADPITTEGDLIVGGASGAPERLPVGTDDQVLTVVAGVPEWADGGGGGGGGTYKFTETGTYAVDLPAGMYVIAALTAAVTINGGEDAIGANATATYNRLFPNGITSLTATVDNSWNPDNRTTTSAQWTYGAAYGAGTYVVSGYNGFLRVSTDGINWTQVYLGINGNIEVAYGAGIFVAVSDQTSVTYYSSDGITWTANSWLGFKYSITYGGGYFFAGGDSGTLYRSSDGISWTETSSGAGNVELVFYDGTYWYKANNGTLYKYDSGTGTHISSVSLPFSYPNSMAYDGTTYVLVTNNEIASSPDAATWTTRDDLGNGHYFVIHDGTRFITANSNTLLTSLDGITWTLNESGAKVLPFLGESNANVYEVIYNAGQYVAAGYNVIGSTTDLFGDPEPVYFTALAGPMTEFPAA